MSEDLEDTIKTVLILSLIFVVIPVGCSYERKIKAETAKIQSECQKCVDTK